MCSGFKDGRVLVLFFYNFYFFFICKSPGLPVIGNALMLSVFVMHVIQC